MRDGGTGGAGVRLGNQKFTYLKASPEVNGAYLSRAGGGGACVATTAKCIIVGVWDKEAKMADGKF